MDLKAITREAVQHGDLRRLHLMTGRQKLQALLNATGIRTRVGTRRAMQMRDSALYGAHTHHGPSEATAQVDRSGISRERENELRSALIAHVGMIHHTLVGADSCGPECRHGTYIITAR